MDSDQSPTYKAILLLNWGIGLEVLNVFIDRNDTEIIFVVTRTEETEDPWATCVYQAALRHQLPIIPQESFRLTTASPWITSNKIDLLFMHAFMKILPGSLLKAPRMGCLNLHPSLLPSYKGKDPTRQVLANHEKETGLTCHYAIDAVDAGNILSQKSIRVFDHDTVSSIIDRLKTIVKDVTVTALECCFAGDLGRNQKR